MELSLKPIMCQICRIPLQSFSSYDVTDRLWQMSQWCYHSIQPLQRWFWYIFQNKNRFKMCGNDVFSQPTGIFRHFNLWIAVARHKINWLKIQWTNSWDFLCIFFTNCQIFPLCTTRIAPRYNRKTNRLIYFDYIYVIIYVHLYKPW